MARCTRGQSVDSGWQTQPRRASVKCDGDIRDRVDCVAGSVAHAGSSSVGGLLRRQPESAQVQAGTADEQSRTPTGFISAIFSVATRAQSAAVKFTDGETKSIQMMWHAEPLCQWHLCRRYLMPR